MRLDIATKLGALFAGVMVAVVALVTVVVSIIIVDRLQQSAYQRLHNDLDVTMHTFEYLAEDARSKARILASNPVLSSDLAAGKPKAAAGVAAQLHNLSSEAIVTVYGSEGQVIYDGGDMGTLRHARRHPAAMHLALAGAESNGFTVLPSNALGLEALAPVHHGTKVVGAVRVGSKLDAAWVRRLKDMTGLEVGIAEGINIGVMPDNTTQARWLAQTILNASHGELATDIPTEEIKEAREAGKPVRRNIVMQGQNYMAALAPLYGAYGEYVAALVIAEATEPLNATVRQTVLAIVLVAVALGALGTLAMRMATRKITAPIRDLVAETARVAEGRFDQRLVVRTGDELEALAEAFNRMGEALVQMRYHDQNANPLTKLPGNLLIESEVNRRLKANEPTAVLYIDLDNFKAFNDAYGFEQGDRAIQLTAEVMRSVCGDNGPQNPAFVGHIGGDDFIVVLRPEVAEEACQALCTEFDRRILELYRKEDRERGGLMSVDRQGQPRYFPFCAVSIAWVDNVSVPLADFLELSSKAADVKKMAKKMPGSSYARDRRGERETGSLNEAV